MGCSEVARYNIEGEPAMYCIVHRLNGELTSALTATHLTRRAFGCTADPNLESTLYLLISFHNCEYQEKNSKELHFSNLLGVASGPLRQER